MKNKKDKPIDNTKELNTTEVKTNDNTNKNRKMKTKSNLTPQKFKLKITQMKIRNIIIK